MDKKDEIILQQLDVIREMTERNLRNVSTDIWGPSANDKTANGRLVNDKSPVSDKNAAATGEASSSNTATSTGASDPPKKEGEETPKEPIEDLKFELDSYIGLSAVKEEVKNLINMVTVWNMRREHKLPAPDLSLHMVFSGNPGTGKTMIARFMARVYHSLGVLSKGQLVEVDRSGLVAGYVGQTAIKTASVLEKAKGGVLFIDEAYSLTSGKADNDFGLEAVETILKFMEDNRDDIIVIVAGYTDLMEEFIESNPGLASRFNRYLYFDDYTVDEMMEIFTLQCKNNFYRLEKSACEASESEGEAGSETRTAEDALREYLAEASLDEDFGNARGVRNVFEKILVRQANRLADAESVTRDELMTITAADIDAARGITTEDDDGGEK
ncbi:MAG: AAA family ATPase [Firmicutes bacterium]|nr:AAA family ATPase [Bacillota bacterium]